MMQHVSSGTESMAKRQKENKEEKKVQPNLYTMHAKCVITIPKDVQLTPNTHGKDLVTHPKPKMNYWA